MPRIPHGQFPQPGSAFYQPGFVPLDVVNPEALSRPLTAGTPSPSATPSTTPSPTPKGSPAAGIGSGSTLSSWIAPESWNVETPAASRGAELAPEDAPEAHVNDAWADEISRLRVRLAEEAALGHPAFVRIHWRDRSRDAFVTLAVSPTATAGDVLAAACRRLFTGETAQFRLVLVAHGMAREMGAMEHPVLQQQVILRRLGYADDELDAAGREDHAYAFEFYLQDAARTGVRAVVVEGDVATGRNCDLAAVPIALMREAPHLRVLDLSKNPSLRELPGDFVAQLQRLSQLRQSWCQLTAVSARLGALAALTFLDLSHNRLVDLPAGTIDRLPRLSEVRLDGNFLEKLPAGLLSACLQLRVLAATCNSFRAFPVDAPSRSLELLDVSFCRIEGALPDVIGGLTGLRVLRAVGNKIEGSLPAALGQCQRLQLLDLRGNMLGIDGQGRTCTQIFSVLDALRDLRWLYLDANAISALDGEAPAASVEDDDPKTGRMLEIATMAHQTRRGLESVFHIARPSLAGTLTKLDLAGCGLASVPAALGAGLSQLTWLDVSENALVSVDELLGNVAGAPFVPRLEHFAAAHNRLTRLPAAICALSQLRHLDVSHNVLAALPDAVWQLGSLRVLNATCNFLEEFPSVPTVEMEQLAALESISARTVASELALAAAEATPTTTDTALPPLSGSLLELHLADNQLSSSVFRALQYLACLERVNLAFNRVTDLSEWFVGVPLLPQIVRGGLELPAGERPPRRSSRRRAPWFAGLRDLNLSGNALLTLPNEIERCRSLQRLVLAANRLGTIPGELSKLAQLQQLDLGSQVGARGEGTGLRYNVANLPYDWNWRWNVQLEYLSLSGNRRLEIVPMRSATEDGPLRPATAKLSVAVPAVPVTSMRRAADGLIPPALQQMILRDKSVLGSNAMAAPLNGRRERQASGASSLTDFDTLQKLRVLGLVDVTCLMALPEERTERRVRTTGSEIPLAGLPDGQLRYALADSPGEGSAEAVALWDLVVPRFRGKDNEALFGVFDGSAAPEGARAARLCFDGFAWHLQHEMARIEQQQASGVGAGKRPSNAGSVSTADAEAEADAAPLLAGYAIGLDEVAMRTALRRAFLALHRELAAAQSAQEQGPSRGFGCLATIVFLYGYAAVSGDLSGARPQDQCVLFVAHVGSGMAVLSRSLGAAQVLTRPHSAPVAAFSSPAGATAEQVREELARIRCAGGVLSSISAAVEREREFTRALGFFGDHGLFSPEPSISRVDLVLEGPPLGDGVPSRPGSRRPSVADSHADASDEFVVVTNGAVWQSLGRGGGGVAAYETAGQRIVDLARSALSGAPLSTKAVDLDDAPIDENVSASVADVGIATPRRGKTLAGSGAAAAHCGWNMAALKVRDTARSMGASSAHDFMVMVVGLRSLTRRSQWWLNLRRGSQQSDDGLGDAAAAAARRLQLAASTPTPAVRELLAPPVGQVALVFTDIKGSTRLWEAHPQAMRDGLRLHHALMRDALREAGGYEVKTEGDAFMVSFASPLSALEWCAAVQQRLLALPWPPELLATEEAGFVYWRRGPNGNALYSRYPPFPEDPERNLLYRGLCVRMGVHYGAPLCEPDPVTSRMDYYGPMVNRAARTCGASMGGQLLLTFDCWRELLAIAARAHRGRHARSGAVDSAPGLLPVAMADGAEKRASAHNAEWVSVTSLGRALPVAPGAYLPLATARLDGQDLAELAAGAAAGPAPAPSPEPSPEWHRVEQLQLRTWLVGKVKLKGLEAPETLYESYPASLSARAPFLARIRAGATPPVEAQPPPVISAALLDSLAVLCRRLDGFVVIDFASAVQSEALTLDRGSGDPTPLERLAGLVRQLEAIVAKL